MSEEGLQSFDPYEILGVSETSTIHEIKKAYRRLAIRYHPDRNPGDPTAEAMFILINKAQECLTDPAKKALCEKFGNPDGQETM